MILVLTGPTGSGKSALALSLAKKIDAVIVNADAFQVYRDLNIATAKPTMSMRMEVPHYLYDFVPLTSSYDVAEYQEDLRATIAELEQEKKNIIIAGGTGLYIRAGLYDYRFEELPSVDLSEYEALSDEELHAKLEAIDPVQAEKIHPHNRRRVLRAIEIYLSSGKSKTEREKEQVHAPIYSDVFFFGIDADRDLLYENLDKRVDEMFEQGLLEETVPLIQRYGRTPRAFAAIGVKELFPYLDGEASLEETKAAIKKATRNYVKRQMTFFRHQFPIIWVKDEEAILHHLNKKM